MRLPLIVATAASLALPAGAVAHAQSGRIQSGSARPARAAEMPAPVERATPARAADGRDLDGRDVYGRDDYHRRHRRAPRYILQPDGTVLADLGYGYEQVIRSCSALQPAPGSASAPLGAAPDPNQHPAPNPNAQPVPNQAAPYQPPVYTPPVYTPPAYTPPVTTSAASTGAAPCWTTDRNGQILIVQQ